MCSRSGNGFVFSLEAGITLLCFFVLIASLSAIDFEDYSDVVLYKQAGDYAQMVMKKGCEYNSTCQQEIVQLLGRRLSGDKCASVTRTVVNNGFSKVEFRLCI